jgi:hypothetical protein
MPESRQFLVLQPTGPELNFALERLVPELVRRAIAKGVIRTPDEARVRPLDALDLGKTTKAFSHTFAADNTWEKYVDAETIGDMVIGIVGIASDSADKRLLDVRFSVGVPLRPIFQTGTLQAMYVQEEPKALFKSGEEPIFEKGDKATIEVYGRSTGEESFVLLGLVVEKK